MFICVDCFVSLLYWAIFNPINVPGEIKASRYSLDQCQHADVYSHLFHQAILEKNAVSVLLLSPSQLALPSGFSNRMLKFGVNTMSNDVVVAS